MVQKGAINACFKHIGITLSFPISSKDQLLLDNNSTALMAQSLNIASIDSRANLLPRNSFGSRIRAPGCRYSDIPSSDRLEIPAPNHLPEK